MFDVLDRLEQDVKDLSVVPADAGLGSGQSEHLVRLERIAAAFDAQRLRLLGGFDRHAACGDDGEPTTEAWLRSKTHLGAGEATARVRTARGLRDLPLVAAAFEAGEITFAHVRAAVMVTRSVDGERVAQGERLLVSAAKRLDAGQFAVAARHWRAQVDTERARAEAAFADDTRTLHASPTIGGMVRIDGMLTPEVGEAFLAVLHPLMQKAGPEDERTTAQRRHDGLGEMARTFLDAGLLPDYGGEKPHLNIHLTAEALTGQQPGAAGRGDWNERFDMSFIAQLACDAAIVRIMMNGKSEILDVGRSTRVISPAIRRVLIARSGGHCEFPGCDRPHRWCDAHHLWAWQDGGPTDLANLVLL